ncbi:YccT family protein [Vibrio genomosp. F10]|uniref:UPF0319 protein A1QO_08430 n=1 Tax=Vibrio genomosp. F10 str. ZF-129 TaxID=1187848 RepID=A0A1E5BEU7_9VIBR|nr:DUF2057 domain-containing protein [Vibrio genomosp. F10]OEE34221.1 hypothetical protein A1QO_08430 [Vibrio genomosp. F10 str. ZF-129]OEE97604.1 hypothetical protein A1QM_14375 [Vibrio genomosp. F10 str. 9ZC157]OEF07386.1 hypothetical protein A1QI_05365 [Vibrio genomosp. F10 str. 9ZB36]
MKVMSKVLVVGAMITSFAPMAAVDLSIERNISALVVHGEEVGFSISKKDKFELENGTNQVVIRVSQLVSDFGEKEKFNSQPIVLTFEASDTSLFVSAPSKISRVEQAEEFEKNPRFVVTDKSGKEIKVRQDILPASSGISRDYIKELARYNAKHSIEGVAVVTTATTAVAVESKPKAKASSDQSQPSQMVEYWYEKASNEERTVFSDWAFDNRKTKEVEVIEGSKALEMASYWYSQCDLSERKQILAWLLEQE